MINKETKANCLTVISLPHTPLYCYLEDSNQKPRVRVTFDIAEGPKTTVKQIYFQGNNNHRTNELQSVILTKQSKWFSFLETNDTYDSDRLEYDKELLKEFYQ